MNPDAFIMIIVSEWKQWLIRRELRCLAGRVRWIDPHDDTAFKRLLETSPFIDLDDEAAFIAVRLPGDLMKHVERSTMFDGADLLRLPLSVAKSFHPVSDRAKELLDVEMDGWNCRIDAPLNGFAWDRWCADEKFRLGVRRGLVVTRFFGLPAPPVEGSTAVSRDDMPTTRALTEEKRSDHEKRCSLGWAETFAHCRARLAGDGAGFSDRDAPVARLVRSRYEVFTLETESFTTEAVLSAADYAESFLESRSAAPIAVLATAAFHHFSFLLSVDRSVGPEVMKSLGSVLEAVRRRYDPELASLLAYEVGLCFPEPFVAALEKHLDAQFYSPLIPSPLPQNAVDLMIVPAGADFRKRPIAMLGPLVTTSSTPSEEANGAPSSESGQSALADPPESLPPSDSSSESNIAAGTECTPVVVLLPDAAAVDGDGDAASTKGKKNRKSRNPGENSSKDRRKSKGASLAAAPTTDVTESEALPLFQEPPQSPPTAAES